MIIHRISANNRKISGLPPFLMFPSARSIKWLRKHVPVVEVVEGKELPEDLREVQLGGVLKLCTNFFVPGLPVAHDGLF